MSMRFPVLPLGPTILIGAGRGRPTAGALGTDRARRIGAELLARPAREPLWQAICASVLAHYEGIDQAPDRQWLAGLKLVLNAPPVRGEYLKVNSAMQEALAEAIAERTGTDMARDMYPQVLAGAAGERVAGEELLLGGCPTAGCLPPRLAESVKQ
jgi:hypothetical protein